MRPTDTLAEWLTRCPATSQSIGIPFGGVSSNLTGVVRLFFAFSKARYGSKRTILMGSNGYKWPSLLDPVMDGDKPCSVSTNNAKTLPRGHVCQAA
jgi:hypothetical protein